LTDFNIAQAHDARAQASAWDRLTNAGGLLVALLLLARVAATLACARNFVTRPVLRVGQAMSRFGEGDRGARAPEQGATEIRVIGKQFNAMADALARQRENQLAFLGGRRPRPAQPDLRAQAGGPGVRPAQAAASGAARTSDDGAGSPPGRPARADGG
jgi:HAMP domain-containing protein